MDKMLNPFNDEPFCLFINLLNCHKVLTERGGVRLNCYHIGNQTNFTCSSHSVYFTNEVFPDPNFY